MPLPRPVLPMTIDEFEHMEHRLGWKHEYWDGAAQLSTQESAVASFQRPIAPLTTPVPLAAGVHNSNSPVTHCSPTPCGSVDSRISSNPPGKGLGDRDSELLLCTLAADEQLRLIHPDDEPGLIELFVIAFDEAIEYAGWPDDAYRRDARDSIGTFFGKSSRQRYDQADPARPDASFVIVTPTQILAAVLVRSIRRGPILQPIMVHPAHHRRGLGTALLSAVLESLLVSGDATLFSRCQLGNAASLAWHERNGFLEFPDYSAATHRWRHFDWLADHFHYAQQPDKAAEMRQFAEHWKCVVKTIAESEGRWSSGLLD